MTRQGAEHERTNAVRDVLESIAGFIGFCLWVLLLARFGLYYAEALN